MDSTTSNTDVTKDKAIEMQSPSAWQSAAGNNRWGSAAASNLSTNYGPDGPPAAKKEEDESQVPPEASGTFSPGCSN